MARPSIAGGASFDLSALDTELRREPAYALSGFTARTLIRESDLRVVLIVMKAGARMPDHRAEETASIQEQVDGRYHALGLTRIEDFNEYFESSLSDEEYDTIGGVVMQQFGRLPRRGEAVTIDGIEFRVQRADRRRIDQLRVTTPGPLPAAPGEARAD